MLNGETFVIASLDLEFGLSLFKFLNIRQIQANIIRSKIHYNFKSDL